MVKTWRRLLDLLQTIDEEPEFKGKHPDEHPNAGMVRERLRKHELLKLCKELHLDVGPDNTMPEMREKLRDEYFPPTYADKSPNTCLSSGEFRRANRIVKQKYRERAEDYSDFYVEDHNTLIVNGEEYEVSGAEVGEVDEAPYDQYHMILLEDNRKRVMILHGLDMDECWYDSDVVLESAGDYGPYKSWRKAEYVEQLEKA